MDVIECGSGAHDIECLVGRGTSVTSVVCRDVSGQSGLGIMGHDEVG